MSPFLLAVLLAPAWHGTPGLVARRPLAPSLERAQLRQRLSPLPDADPTAMPPRSAVGGGAVRAVWGLAARRVALSALVASWPLVASASGAEGKLHVGQRLALSLQGLGLPDTAVLLLISAMPVVELRGAIPVGTWMGLDPARTFATCVLGNTAAVVALLAALRLPVVEGLLAPLLRRAQAKMEDMAVEKSRVPLALALFVGVPLPGTGGWTGAMIAHLIGLPFQKAALSIFGGVVMAGVIMTALSLAGWYGAAVASAALVVFVAGAIAKGRGAEDGAQGAS